jgi:glycosyltransferase involved in cell wall biosynthesis
LRAQWQLRRRVAQFLRREKIDLILATVLPGYTSLVGSWAKRRFNISFVLDYQDPWVGNRSNSERSWTKSGLAHRIANWLEPKVLQNVDALTAVSDETLDTLRARNLISPNIPIEIIPIGADREDHAIAQRYGRSLIDRADGKFHIAYLGTLTNRMLPSLEAFLKAVRELADSEFARIQIHLIGTSAQPAGEDQHNLCALIGELGLTGHVHLHPARVGYLDALRTMQNADLLLLLGSIDSHYTASKIFPCWLAKKPILGLFHSASTVNQLARELGGISLVTYDAEHPPDSKTKDVAAALREILEEPEALTNLRHEPAFETYSADGVARKYAGLFDRLVAQRNAPAVS